MKQELKAADGRLAVLIAGVGGAVSTTMIAGVMAARRGLAKPIGSVTQMGRMRRQDGREQLIKEMLPIAGLDSLVFGGWDIFPDNALEAARCAEVLSEKDLKGVADELATIRPMAAAFDPRWAKRLHGTHTLQGATRREMIEHLRGDIRRFMADNKCSRAVVLWAASTEIFLPMTDEHRSLESLDRAIDANNTEVISPSMCYAYAALSEGVPFIMGAPNLCVDIPAMWELAVQNPVPIAGKDFKSGQTLMKTVLAPMFKTRLLGVSGWFSTNILGNRDGEVLDDPDNFKTKEVSKLGVIDTILKADEQPELYGDIYHKVRINYYPPRGDAKEGWDNLDICGWMGKDYGMQIKVDFLCRDSILAAPIVLDLVVCADLAHRAGLKGIQRWMSFFLKSPMHDFTQGEEPIHDLFQQYILFKNQIRLLGGYEADEELD